MSLQQLETKLDEIFNKKAPQLPTGLKKLLVEWSPWIALIAGIGSVFSAVSLWNAARGVHYSAYYYQQLCSTYQGVSGHCGVPTVASHLGFWLWLAAIFLISQGVLYLRAYPRLQAHLKEGWNFLFYAELAYIAYAVATLFTGFNVTDHFFSAAIGIAISFYLLFQVRPLFLEAPLPVSKAAAPQAPTAVEDQPEPEPEPESTPVVIVEAPAETSSMPQLAAAPEIITPAVVASKEPTKATPKKRTKAATKPKAKAKTTKPAAKKKPRKITKKKA